jgi:hypothetical protein
MTDEQIESMANACGLYGVRKAVVQCVRELLATHPDNSGDGGEKAPCVHADEPKACYRVRCQLGNKCVDDDMSFRRTAPVPQDGDEREELALELTVAFAPKHEYRDPDTGENCFSALGFARDLIAALASSKAASVAARPTDDVLWDQTLTERDNYHEWADKLANAIAEHFGIEIGEHSNLNNPWPVALEALENMAAQKAHAWRTTEPAVCVPMTEDSGVAALWREAGFDVIELFEHPAPIASSLSDRDIQEAALEWQCDPAFDHFVFHEDELVEYVRGILARVHSAASRAEVLEQAASLIEPKNEPSDWTEYAKIKAECAAAIRAIKEKL